MFDGSLHTFQRWSLSHWAAIVATVIAAAVLSGLRQRWHDQPAGRRLDQGLALFVAVTWVVMRILKATLAQFPARTALPFHVTDLTYLALGLALWWGWRWARSLVYYWGLALGTLAFILPDLHDGPARLGYWTFWLAHLLITTGVVYEIVGRNLRPRWRDFARVAVISLIYVLLITPFNAITGHSYGYLGPPHDEEPQALRYFGPWPLRVVPLVAAGLAGMALLTVPWVYFSGRRGDPRRGAVIPTRPLQ